MRIEHLKTPGSLKAWLQDTAKEGEQYIALDLETTGLTRNDRIISGAVTGPGEWVAYFGPELLHELVDAPSVLTFIYHNAPFDIKHLGWAGCRLAYRDYVDTLILAHLLDENRDHSLGALVLEHFNDNYKAEFWSKYKKAEDAPEKDLIEYNCKDVYYTKKLREVLTAQLHVDSVPELLWDHVHKLQRSLLSTEIEGIAIDHDYLMQKGVELKSRITQLLPQMREMVAGEIAEIECEQWLKEIDKRSTDKGRARVPRPEFSFDSSKQLMVLLYDKLGLKEQINEKTKKPTCDWDALEALKDEHPIVKAIQDYREANKIYGTYIEGTLERAVDGRIFPSFNVCGTSTGRLSHSNPNMGNLPRAGGIRGIFTPDPGHYFVSADFSQLEVCLSAHFTGDTNLLRIVNEGASQHDITAASLGIPRNIAKNVNFACQYGAGAFKLAKMLGVSNAEGEKALAKYWETYSGQKRVMDECAAKVDRAEPIINPFGRRRRFEKCARKPWDSAYRQSFNALIQGTGSDLTSRALYLADARLRSLGIGKALFSIHDEILVQAKKEHWEQAQEILVSIMESVGDEIGLTVKLKAQPSGACERWLD